MEELKTNEKIVQQMTRDGAVEVNKSTSGAARISAREQSVSHVPRVIDRVQAEHGAAKSRAVKKANRKIYENTRRKPETPQLTFREREQPPNGKFTHIIKRPGREAAIAVHREVDKSERENSGVQAAHFTERAAEGAARQIGDLQSRLRFEPQRELFKTEEKAVKTNVNAMYNRDLQTKPELEKASAYKKAAYKRKLKKEYTQNLRQGNVEGAKKAAEKAKKTAQKAGETAEQTAKSISKNGKWLAIIGGILGFVILLAAGVSSCMSMFGGGFNAVIGTSYTAEDEDILGADADYTILQNELAANIYNIPSVYPGYDEYNFSLDEIMHDPFGLASYLTAKYNAYTQAGVQAELAYILSQQYTLTLTPVTEIRQRVEIHTEIHTGTYIDDDGEEVEYEYEVDVEVEVEYEYYILNISLVNNAVGSVALSSLTPEQYEMYLVYMETKGNKPELFP